jgi:hypothetical protein
VVATDLDLTVLRDLSRPNLDLRRHDVLVDALPEAEFDLVHARLLLAWLPECRTALARLIAALKPGGWLVSEELEFVSAVPDARMDPEDRELFAHVAAAHNQVLAERNGFDPFFGRRLAGDWPTPGSRRPGPRDARSRGRAARRAAGSGSSRSRRSATRSSRSGS